MKITDRIVQLPVLRKVNFSQYKLPFYSVFSLFLIIGYSIFVRAQDLGYSNYQGDEVDTLDFIYFMQPGAGGLWAYLIAKKRGPIQYLFNILNVNLFGYINELQIRFPYLIFGVLAIFIIYILAKKLYNPTTALFAATLMGVNGLFIAFSRITQYQSMMCVLIPIGLIIFIKALNQNSNKLLTYSGLIMSVALLLHYDTLSTIGFFMAGFIAHFIREIYKDEKELSIGTLFQQINSNRKLLRSYLLKMLIFFSAFLIPALFYYIPFTLGNSFEDKTSGYLTNRFSGGSFMPRTDITDKLMTIYMPEYFLNFFFVMGIVGVLFNIKSVVGVKFLKINLNISRARIMFGFFTILILLSTIFSFYPIKPRTSSLLVIGASVVVSILLVLYRKVKWERAAIITWFLGSYSFYLFVVKDPRTHVYIAMIPMLFVAGYGISKLYFLLKNYFARNVFLLLVIGFFVFVSAVSWPIFVDKNPEYPSWDKDFLGWPIYRISRIRHDKIEGVFGFNRYNGWQIVGDLYKRGCLVGSFNSNEKDSVTFFYTGIHQVKGRDQAFQLKGDNLIAVENPDSWEYIEQDEKIPEGDFVLLGEISSGNFVVSHIYGKRSVYPDGTFLCKN